MAEWAEAATDMVRMSAEVITVEEEEEEAAITMDQGSADTAAIADISTTKISSIYCCETFLIDLAKL